MRALFLLVAAAAALESPVKLADHVVPRTAACSRYMRKDVTDRCEAITGCLERGESELKERLRKTPLSRTRKRVELHEELAQLYAYESRTLHLSVHEFRKAWSLARAERLPEADALLAKLGITQLRLGELKNCIANHNADSCIFPLSENARHRDAGGAREALRSFEEYLSRRPDDDHIRWLLNVAWSALGGYPHKVPKDKLMPLSLFASEERIPRFKDRAHEWGIRPHLWSGGALADDFTGDGLPDLVLSSRGFCDPSYFYVNTGKGFVDRSLESGIGAQRYVGHLVPVDYDNDGKLDLYMTRGAWDLSQFNKGFARMPTYNSLMRNLGDGRFEDVAERVGLRGEPNSNRVSLWADYDGNGWVDVLVCNEQRGPDLFLNKDGRFTNQIAESGLTNDGICKGGAAGDVDNDGDEDVFLSNWGAENRLWLNQGDGTFQRSEQRPLETQPHLSYTAWLWDYDNDGWLDLFVAAYSANTKDAILALQGKPNAGESHRVFRNVKGRFEDVTAALGLERTVLTMGANFGDVDNDGFEDFLLGTGSVGFGDATPNALYKSLGGKRFVDVTVAGGFGNLQKGHGISFADLDNDGDQDILAQFGGVSPSDSYSPSVYINPGTTNSWLTLRLEGRQANRAAIGSRVRLKAGGRTFHRQVGPGGTFGSNSLQVEAGLGKARKVDELEIVWAGSGRRDVYRDVPVNRVLRIVEGESKPIVQTGVNFQANALRSTGTNAE